MFLIKTFNFIFGKWLRSQNAHVNLSMTYSSRKRNIDIRYLDYIRLAALELAANEIKRKKVNGNVAEVGVYKGKFAKFINEYFPDRKLYLFDTFEGFDEKDKQKEKELGLTEAKQDFSNTSVNKVLELMPFPKQCIIKKGFFPESASGLEESFAFVSLDTDLYEPIYQGLVYFYPRMEKGGYIFVHDVNNDSYKGASRAVDKFSLEKNISFVPIPDSCGSVVFVKN